MKFDSQAGLATKHALMVTKWTCSTCGKPNTLMLMKPENWDKDNNVMCGKCHKMSKIRHRQVIKI